MRRRFFSENPQSKTRPHSFPRPLSAGGKIQPRFCQILSPKNCFRKTESALVPPPAQKLHGQNTKEKCPFLFRRNWSRANPKSKEHFSLVSAEALRGGGGADSFVQFPLEKGSCKVYNYSTNKNRLCRFFVWRGARQLLTLRRGLEKLLPYLRTASA